jgi:hypothetical protein
MALQSCHAERFHFSVSAAKLPMPSLADDLTSLHQNGTDHRIWAHPAQAAPGKLQRALHVKTVLLTKRGHNELAFCENLRAPREGTVRGLNLADARCELQTAWSTITLYYPSPIQTLTVGP